MIVFDKILRICVGTDLSRPCRQSTADKDVINRSLQATYPHYFIKPHHRVLLRVSRGQRGRDESVPTQIRPNLFNSINIAPHGIIIPITFIRY